MTIPARPAILTVSDCMSNNHESGYILIVYSCLISFAFILFAAGYWRFQESHFQQLEREIASVKAFYIAQAGLKKAALAVAGARSFALTQPVNFGGGDYTLTFEGHSSTDPTYATYKSVGRFKGVQRALCADIIDPNRSPSPSPSPFSHWLNDQFPITEALYVHDLFIISRVPGTVYGKHVTALRSGSDYAINSAQLLNYGISLLCDSGKCVIQRQPRGDYRSLWSEIRTEAEQVCYLTCNANSNLVSNHRSGGLQTVTLKDPSRVTTIGTYTYNINLAGRLLSATLTIANNRTLNLRSGTYYLDRLILGSASTLTGDPPVTIICTSELTLNQGAEIRIGDEDHPGCFFIGYQRITGATPPPQVDLHRGSAFYGKILAPYWTFTMYDGVEVYGAVLVDDVTLDTESFSPPRWRIEFPDLQSSEPPSIPFIINWREVRSES